MLLVIPAGKPESSHKDVKLQVYSYAKLSTCEVSSYRPWHWIPASLPE